MVRDRTELLHQGQAIKEPLELRNLARSEAVEDGAGYCYLSSGRGHPLKLPLVRPPTRPPLSHSCSFSHHLIGRGVPVGKGTSQAGCKGFEVIETDLPSPGKKDRRGSLDQFIGCCQIPLVPELLVKQARQRLILFAYHF